MVRARASPDHCLSATARDRPPVALRRRGPRRSEVEGDLLELF